MKLFRTGLLLLLACAAVSSAWAQGTGGLTIVVVDPTGLPLPGATVTLTHVAGNVAATSVSTDGKGMAEFPVLRPGPGYAVEVSFPGMGTRREAGLRAPIGDVSYVTVTLAEELQERVRVEATEDVVQLEQTSSSAKFSDEFVQDLPVPGRFYQNILTLAPGVQDPDGDGNPTVHGSRSRDFRAEVSGVSNVDPLTGQQMANVNMDTIDEIEVITGGAGVEFGRAQGGFARVIQKQGTNEFEGTFGLLFSSSRLDGTGAADLSNLPDPEFESFWPSAQISGPLIKDKLWYRLSHDYQSREDPVNVVGGIVVQTTERSTNADQLTWQVSPRNKLAFQYQSDPLRIDAFGVSSTTPFEATQVLDRGTDQYSVTWTAPYSPKLLVDSTIAWQDLQTDLLPTTTLANNCVAYSSEFLENARCTNFETQETSGGHNLTVNSDNQRFTARSQATLYGGRFWGANHTFKFGFSVENEQFTQRLEQRPEIGFFILDPIDDPETAANPDPIPIVTATVAIPTVAETTAKGANWGLYLEDTIKPINNLVITAGLRVDREEIYSNGTSVLDPARESAAYQSLLAQPGTVPDAALRNAFTRWEGIDQFVTQLSQITGTPRTEIVKAMSPVTLQSEFWTKNRTQDNITLNSTNWSPFLAVSWDPWNNGKNKFSVSGRRYHDKTVLLIPLIELNPATTTIAYEGASVLVGTCSQSGSECSTNADCPLANETCGNLRSMTQVCPTCLRNNVNPAVNIAALDRQSETPYQDEFRLLYERELFTETLMRVEYINRKFRNQYGNFDINRASGDFGRCNQQFSPIEPVILAAPGASDPNDPLTWLTDPYTGVAYMDTDPGNGDGIMDDCVGKFDVLEQDLTAPLNRPDLVPDLYTLNPGWAQMAVVGNYNFSDYEGFVLELIRRQYRSWEMQGSYTWSQNKGNGEDFRQFIGLDQSRLDQEFGWDSNDQRHVVKVSATSITPWGFRLGGSVRWQSGLPYSVLIQRLSVDYSVPTYPEAVRGANAGRNRLTYPDGVRNSGRNTSQWLVDMRATKEMNLGRGLNMQLSVEVFNLFNDGTYSIYNPDFEQGFQINGVNDARREFGRRWQLGMKMAF